MVVKDVKPYEFMKLRLLNGGHSCLSYISVLCGYNYVDDAMADPHISGDNPKPATPTRCFVGPNFQHHMLSTSLLALAGSALFFGI